MIGHRGGDRPAPRAGDAVYLSHSRRSLATLIRLGRLLVELLPEPDTRGLLPLMLLHDSPKGVTGTRNLREPRIGAKLVTPANTRGSGFLGPAGCRLPGTRREGHFFRPFVSFRRRIVGL